MRIPGNFASNMRYMASYIPRIACVFLFPVFTFGTAMAGSGDASSQESDRLEKMEARIRALEARLEENEAESEEAREEARRMREEAQQKLKEAETLNEAADSGNEDTILRRQASMDILAGSAWRNLRWTREEQWEGIEKGVSKEKVVELLGTPPRSVDSMKPRVDEVYFYETSLMDRSNALRGKISFRKGKVLSVEAPNFQRAARSRQ